MRLPLLGLDMAALEAEVERLQLPRFRARQLWRWVWRHGITDFSDMTDLASQCNSYLQADFMLTALLSRRQKSLDGTIKWLLKMADGQEAEMVYIPEEDRGTLCISSQVATLNCSFCHTGTQRLVRNLEIDEICGQILLAMDELGDWPAGKPDRRLTNIVLMGMGELYIISNVRDALKIIMSGEGIRLSRRRVTLSTSGVVPEIHRCGAIWELIWPFRFMR